jgi:hypothetical protein
MNSSVMTAQSGPCGTTIPGRLEHGAEGVGMLFGEFGGIADADDPARWVALPLLGAQVTPCPGYVAFIPPPFDSLAPTPGEISAF